MINKMLVLSVYCVLFLKSNLIFAVLEEETEPEHGVSLKNNDYFVQVIERYRRDYKTNQAPAYEARAPAYAVQPPSYGVQPPAYATRPPAYATQPPAYATQPPAYEAQPPGQNSQVSPTKYRVPNPLIEAYSPSGLRISIPDAPGIQSFHVHLNVNNKMSGLEAGEHSKSITEADDEGNWTFFLPNLALKVNDVLYFWLKVVKFGRSYRLLNAKRSIKELIEEDYDDHDETDKPVHKEPNKPVLEVLSEPEHNQCEGITTVNGKQICQKTVILDENFSTTRIFGQNVTINEALQADMATTVGDEPDRNFVIFSKDYGNCYIDSSKLVFIPQLLSDKFNDSFISDGSFVVNNCTSLIADACKREAFAWNILPIVLSARLTTKNVFSFRYGIIEVRAKLPGGDWLVPEIWLEQKNDKYRENRGKIYLAYSLGNQELKDSNGKEIGRKLIKQGYSLGKDKPVVFFNKTLTKEQSSDFHNFKLEWHPDYLKFYIDNDLMKEIRPESKLSYFLKGSKMAPFDEEYYMTFGLHVGGRSDFPDGCTSGTHKKPWSNSDLKAMIHFWEKRNDWLLSWSGKSKLVIEHIKITSL